MFRAFLSNEGRLYPIQAESVKGFFAKKNQSLQTPIKWLSRDAFCAKKDPLKNYRTNLFLNFYIYKSGVKNQTGKTPLAGRQNHLTGRLDFRIRVRYFFTINPNPARFGQALRFIVEKKPALQHTTACRFRSLPLHNLN